MSGYRPHSSYKESYLEWLGKVPTHWEIRRIKTVFSLIVDPAPENNTEELLSIYTAIGVRPRKELEQKGNKSSTTDGYWRVQKGDFIVNKLLAWMGAIGISEYDGVTSPAYDILRPAIPIQGNFYHNLFRMSSFSQEIKKYSRGIMDMRLRIYFEELGALLIPYPPIEEQKFIATFLDRETSKLDVLIREQKELITLLQEKRQALISNAVTKGLNPKAKMKDSGVEWLGEMPDHWEVKKMTYLFQVISSGTTPPSGESRFYENGTVPWVNTGDLNDWYLESCEKKVTEDAIIEFTSLKTYPPGSIIFAMYGATIGKLSISKFAATVNQACCVFSHPLGVNTKFVFFWLHSFRQRIISLATGGGQPNINQEILRSLRLSYPPIHEQAEIIGFLTGELRNLDALIKEAEETIELMHEHRASLISEAVTGKIDVRKQA